MSPTITEWIADLIVSHANSRDGEGGGVKITILAAFAILTGCLDYIPPQVSIAGANDPYVCGTYQLDSLADSTKWTVQDSTRVCADGTMPVLFEATWLDTQYDCPVVWGAVYPGSIRRRFGCPPAGMWTGGTL